MTDLQIVSRGDATLAKASRVVHIKRIEVDFKEERTKRPIAIRLTMNDVPLDSSPWFEYKEKVALDVNRQFDLTSRIAISVRKKHIVRDHRDILKTSIDLKDLFMKPIHLIDEPDGKKLSIKIQCEAAGEFVDLIRLLIEESQKQMESMKEFMQRVAKVCEYFNICVKVAMAPAEANSVAKATVSAVALLCECCKTFDKCYKAASDIMGDIASFLPFTEIPLGRLKSNTTEKTVEEMLVLFEKIVRSILEYSSNRTLGALLAVDERLDEVNSYKGDLLRAKEMLDWCIKTEVWKTVLNTEQNTDTLVLDKLCPVMDAFYEKKATCLEGSRRKMVRIIMNWTANTSGPKIFWLHGFAGSGKTTIAHTVAKMLNHENRLAGCFFCAGDSTKHNNPEKVIPTIAYQLSKWHKAYRSLVVELLNGPGELELRTGLEKQYELLVEKPLRQLAVDVLPSHKPLVVVFDALDQCGDSDVSRRFLLAYIRRIAATAPWLKVFISSTKTSAIEDGLQCDDTRVCDIGDPWHVLQDDISGYVTHLEESRVVTGIRGDFLRYRLPSLISKIHEGIGLAANGSSSSDFDVTMSEWCLETMKSQLKFNICSLASAHLKNKKVVGLKSQITRNLSGQLRYSCLYWMDHIVQSNDAHCLRDRVLKILYVPTALHWTEVLSLTDSLENGKAILQKCIEYFQGDGEIVQAAAAMHTFISDFHDAISISTPHVYISALSWGLQGLTKALHRQESIEALERPQSQAGTTNSTDKLTEGLGSALCFSLSPDGSKFASGHRDGHLRVWDAVTGKLIRRVKGHDTGINDVTFSPDGNRIATGACDTTLRIWDVQSGDLVATLKGHTRPVLAVTYSPDGTRIVSGSLDWTLCIWNAQSGAAIGYFLEGHSDYVFAVAFSPDGSRIASGSGDNTVRVWDARSGRQIGEPLRGHDDSVWCVAFSPDSKKIVSGSRDETVRVWDVRTGAPVGKLNGHEGQVYSSADKTVRVWDVRTGASVGEPMKGHKNCISSVAYTPDGSRIISGSWDNTLRIWDAINQDPIGVIPRGESRWDPDGGCFLSYPGWWPSGPYPRTETLIHSDAPTQISEYGWLRTLDDGLFVWVPPRYREYVCCRGPTGKIPPRMRFDWKKVPHGKDWTRVKEMIEGSNEQ